MIKKRSIKKSFQKCQLCLNNCTYGRQNGESAKSLVFSHSDVTGWTIQLGITRRHSHAFYGQKMKVKRVVPHPMYNLGIAHDNDVALFQVSVITINQHEFLFQPYPPPIRLLSRRFNIPILHFSPKNRPLGLNEIHL